MRRQSYSLGRYAEFRQLLGETVDRKPRSRGQYRTAARYMKPMQVGSVPSTRSWSGR